jgi:ankyrin repeat protein
MRLTQAALQVLLQAAEQDFSSLKTLMGEYGADSLTPASKGTALLVACSRGHLEVVQYLVDTVGADIEATDANGITPLVLAQRKRRHKVARYLKFVMELKRTSACNSTSSIALLSAFKDQFFQSLTDGDLDSVRKTIQQNGSIVVEISHNSGLKALHLACAKGHIHIVHHLVSKAGVNVEATATTAGNGLARCTALYCAALFGHLGLVRFLVETLGASIEATNAHGRTPLHCACDVGNLEIVQYLVATAGAKVEATSAHGDTPLHRACAQGYVEIVQYLVGTADANVEAANKDGCTPLHLAIEFGHWQIGQSGKIVRYLVGIAHANVEATTKDGSTALHLIHDDLNTLQYLVEIGGANVGVANNQGQTPLHTAGSLQMVRYLVECTDVDLLATDVRGMTRSDMSKAFSPNRKVAGYLQRFEHIHAALA